MPCWKSFFLCLVGLCLMLSAAAQKADFTADKTSGCSPLAVQFTNTSSGYTSAAIYSWDFGNTNSSTLVNPGTTYNNEGVYTVTLTITEDGKPTTTQTLQVTVHKKPVVDFSVDLTKGCSPLNVTFTSNSTPGDGEISNYTWDFGDGNALAGTSTQPHTYTLSNDITPSLTVTNSFGCYNTISKPEMITVLPGVVASFQPSKNVLCSVSEPVTFTNSSAGTGNLSYNWDFGDGNTSTEKDPNHTYTKPGLYPVKLTATSPNGCSSDTTLTNFLNVASFQTDFEVPSPICQNASAVLIDKSTPVPTTSVWTINGAFSTDTANRQLQTTFSSAGTYQVTLSNSYETCPQSITKTVTVQAAPSFTGFVAKLQGSCGAPVTVQFSDTSHGADAWQWDFTGSGTFTGSGQNPTYQYTTDGTYNVTLKASNSNGCTTQVTQPVTIGKAAVAIQSSEGNLGCETKTTVFSAVSTDLITKYDWNFGDGTAGSTDATPEHIFTAPGDYTVILNYTLAGGCSDSTSYVVHVYEKPKFDFSAEQVACGNNPVTFTVTGVNLAGIYLWNFGDPDVYEGGPIPNTHRYQYDSVYTVSLIIDNNGCRDTVTKPNYITVVPPFSHISSAINTCEGTRGLVTFTESARKAQHFSWDFGDGSAPLTYNNNSKPSPIQHEYSATGTYRTILTVTNDRYPQCSVTDTLGVPVLIKQNPTLTSGKTTFCSSDTVLANLNGLDKNPSYGISMYGYNLVSAQYEDGTNLAGNIYFTGDTSRNIIGVHMSDLDVDQSKIRIVTVSQNFGCYDTTNYLSFESLGPTAKFSITQNNLCFKTPVLFTDSSKGSHNSPIVKWDWNFGDSSLQSNTQATPVIHRYTTPGTYNASLTVTDANGCTSTTPDTTGIVTIAGPQAAFSLSQDLVLPAVDISFYNQTNTLNTNPADNKYTWSFGDGRILRNQDYADSIVHSYEKEGIDTVVLIAVNRAINCADTAVKIVTVKNPNLYFTYTTTYVNPSAGCPPVIASFLNKSINTTRISWNFGDGSTAEDLDNASHIYEKPGVYKVTLYGYFLDGSVDSTWEYITIAGPYATLQTVKPFACGAELITLQATSSNTRNFTWDFGDGTLLNNADTFASHRYLTPGVYTPSLIVSDGNNCKFPFFLTKPIIVDTLHLDIVKNPAVACDSSLLLFTPNTVSEAKDLGYPLVYHWNFGSGLAKDTANTEQSSFVYNKAATYEVTLTGASPFGCKDTATQTIVVQPTPRAFIAGPAKICEGDSALFTGAATKTVTWYWDFKNGDTSNNPNPPSQIYRTPGLDSVSLIVNSNGCYDTAWHPLLVNAKPVISPSPLSAHLCQGDSVQLQAYDGISYQWSPNQNISGSNTATPFVHPDTATRYYVKVTNAAGCTNTDSIRIDVTQRFDVTAPSPVYICPGGIAQLNASGADKYLWLNSNVSNPTIANPTTSTYASQNYTVVGSDSYGCFTDTTSVFVATANLPTVNAGNDITISAGTPVPLQATGSDDVVKWRWIPATDLACDTCQNTTLTPHADRAYILQGTNRSGCVATDTVQVSIICKMTLVQIPSAFTPNGDGRNDYFSVKGRGIREIRHFAVFNRLGEKLFEQSHMAASDITTGWDGTYQNKAMASGTYVYIVEIVCDTGETFNYKGTVVLIR